VEVGTLNDQIPLRGTVRTEADRVSIAAIVVKCSRLELGDDQISIAPTIK
jgi:hypothetical protein